MTDCSKIPTLKLVEDSKRAMEDTVEFAGSPETTYESSIDGKTKKTIQGVTKDALNAFRLGAGEPQGNYSTGVTYDEPNWTYTYNGQQWGIGKDFDLSNLPYITTEIDPSNDINLAVRGNASQEYVQTEVTQGQEELLPLGSQIHPESGKLANGMAVPTGTTHLRIDDFIARFSPSTSGSVTAINRNIANVATSVVVDNQEVHMIDIQFTHLYLSEMQLKLLMTLWKSTV